jgi:hypothetical protein
MEAKELRIGNLAQDKEGNIHTIIGIESSLGWNDDVNTAFSKYLESVRTDLTLQERIYLSQLKPIPITEEWFLKFGFQFIHLHSRIKIYSLDGFQYRSSKYSRGLKHRQLSNLKKTIQYVHQLQNLYFLLTNKELTIK